MTKIFVNLFTIILQFPSVRSGPFQPVPTTVHAHTFFTSLLVITVVVTGGNHGSLSGDLLSILTILTTIAVIVYDLIDIGTDRNDKNSLLR
jgi:hypothetical protein